MSRPTERELEAIRDFYKTVAPQLNDWRRRWDVDSMPDPQRVFAAAMDTVLQWWLEWHCPDKQDALAQLSFFEKVWRMTIERTPNWGKRL